jgi:hypothetical protein
VHNISHNQMVLLPLADPVDADSRHFQDSI